MLLKLGCLLLDFYRTTPSQRLTVCLRLYETIRTIYRDHQPRERGGSLFVRQDNAERKDGKIGINRNELYRGNMAEIVWPSLQDQGRRDGHSYNSDCIPHTGI